MDNICYLEYISRPEQPFIIFYTCTIEVNLTSTKVRVVSKPYNGVTGNGVTRNGVTSFFFLFFSETRFLQTSQTIEQDKNLTLACSKRSDSGERCEVKKAIKSIV